MLMRLVETLHRRASRQRLKIPIPRLVPDPARKPLAIVAIARDEAEYLKEWIEFHLLMGADHIYLYDNESKDGTNVFVQDYVQRKLLTLVHWPNPAMASPQLTAYADAILRFGRHWRWMAFIDIDEFLYTPTGVTLVDVLERDFAHAAAVEVPWRNFGYSGHDAKPDEPVIGAYTVRAAFEAENEHLQKVKSIVDPCRVACVFSAHRFAMYDARPVRLNRNTDRLRINHYYTKSRSEFQRKLAQDVVFWGTLPHSAQKEIDRRLRIAESIEKAPVRDEAILQFLPALKARL